MTSAGAPLQRPVPVVTADNAFYWEGAARGQLLVQGCAACGALCHPPSPLCPSCHSAERMIREMSGRGRVVSFIIVHHPPNPWFELPVAVATVELEEGPRVISNVCAVALEELDLGLAVEVFFAVTEQDGVGVPLFRPAGRP